MPERDLYRLRAAIGREARCVTRNPHDEAARLRLDQARRDYREALLAGHISEVVNAAPPLTLEQRDRLALLLRGSAA